MELPAFLKEPPPRESTGETSQRAVGQYSISDVLLVTALFGTALASLQLSIGFGVMVLALAIAAVIRTVVLERLRAGDPKMGRPSSPGLEVCVSPFVILLAGGCGFAVFMASGLVAVPLSWAMGDLDGDFLLLWLLAIGVPLGFAVMVLVLWFTRNFAKHL